MNGLYHSAVDDRKQFRELKQMEGTTDNTDEHSAACRLTTKRATVCGAESKD